jgi:hypothetical protein
MHVRKDSSRPQRPPRRENLTGGGRMLREVEVQDTPAIMADDKEAVEDAEVIVGTVKKSMAAIASL